MSYGFTGIVFIYSQSDGRYRANVAGSARTMKRLLRDRSARFGLIIIALLVLCAVFVTCWRRFLRM